MAQLKLLLVGLGNPGRQYERNRHNVGFLLLDDLAKDWDVTYSSSAKESKGKIDRNGITFHFLKPLEYMNLSGRAVAELARKNGIPPENILVIHDEVDFPFSKLKFKQSGGHGGHNGLKDIIEKLGSPDFFRLRFGVGKPGDSALTSGHVLSNFRKEEMEQMPELFLAAKQKISDWVREREILFSKASDK
ncbi:aminoacyl-tRNA hydrolase [Leptospira wolffii]|uniref:aminoacyl-tRNA hydrolase n=1 Tax=Leptospira wolffii TaxID=409998 RepID=UPI00108273A3|nr:aminoacyl-tRNA hydrolase [Leptospira wolffii]TGK56669.1 aminoacyl-tRNA hydrolase [Leptospira wolffii]TGK71749.1 aminoacyl-tRNA hydrolase [Leptospira wolffii]TGK75394.1 aminoacyl-tRNA hydrolase [Leptospira wolffii]TGL33116.1 aminoacyl-tRNA hydrolase [Leptospira wolffii]